MTRSSEELDSKTMAVIEEFQAQRRDFQSRWNRNMLLVAFPAFGVFILGLLMGGPVGAGVAVVALAVVGAALARGVHLVKTSRGCPLCGQVQDLSVHYPYRSCPGCGARLSHGAKDSS